MTKMAAMPLYGKNFLLWNRLTDFNTTCYVASGTPARYVASGTPAHHSLFKS